MKTLLSIDWDFFFPDVAPYDWGHIESPLFYETIWITRCASFNLLTKQLAIDTMLPDQELLKSFWEKTVSGKPKQVFIADSHLELYKVLEKVGPCLIDNFDAHHDFGYSDSFMQIDCGNWARKAMEYDLNPSYQLFYPEWRKECPETLKIKSGLFSIFFGLKKAPTHYDYIFVCRSSAWTPTWADTEWMKFIRHWDSPWSISRNVWKDRITITPFAEVVRFPSLKQAREIAEKAHLNYAMFFNRLRERGIPPKTTIKSTGKIKDSIKRRVD